MLNWRRVCLTPSRNFFKPWHVFSACLASLSNLFAGLYSTYIHVHNPRHHRVCCCCCCCCWSVSCRGKCISQTKNITNHRGKQEEKIKAKEERWRKRASKRAIEKNADNVKRIVFMFRCAVWSPFVQWITRARVIYVLVLCAVLCCKQFIG